MDLITKRITDWAATRTEIRLILMVGSRTRAFPPADEWADLDLHIFCTNCEALLADPGWLEAIAGVWIWLPEQISAEIPQLLVLFEGGEKVDFAFPPLSMLRGFIATGKLDEIHARGFSVLLDKDGWAERLPAASARPARREPPTEEAFRRVVDTFFYGAVYVAKQIRRSNLWVVKFRDWTMKTGLLQMMVWHARALHGPEYDTYYDGHFMAAWAEPQTWEMLYLAFGGFGAPESWQSLFVTMKGFRQLATQTAQIWRYEYPAALDRRITAYVEDLFNGSKSSILTP